MNPKCNVNAVKSYRYKMKLLICLKVKYGYPINALYGFLKKTDREEWDSFFKNISYEICVNQPDGLIYILLENCEDLTKFKKELFQLPLIKEEFLEICIFQFLNFESINSLFVHQPYK